MNFKKVNNSKFELDKSQSEIILENKVNELFDFLHLQSELMDDYYNQVLTPLHEFTSLKFEDII